jgi:hypothetical protein
VQAELEDLLAGIGMRAGDSGGEVTFQGADPVVPSTLRHPAAAGCGEKESPKPRTALPHRNRKKGNCHDEYQNRTAT